MTTATRGRSPVFGDWKAAAAACAVTTDADVLGQSRLLAWVLMPDHFHALLLVGGAIPLSGVVRRIKANMALCANRVRGVSGPVWQHGFHDHAVRREEDLEVMARYIIANPVRAGLVAQEGDYPYWNMDWI